MENVSEALMLAFAVLIFVIALTVTFSTFAQAKHTADVVLMYSDRENFQTLKDYNKDDYYNGVRTVGKDTVIATVARCIKEKFTAKIIDLDGKVYNFEYDTVLSSSEIHDKFIDFIKNCKGNKFKETYVETIVSGKIYDGNDGTRLGVDSGEKLYITYEAKPEV